MSTHSQTVSPVSPAHGSYLSSSLSSSNLSASSYLVSPVQRATVQFTGSNLASSSPVTNSHGVYPTSVQPPRSPPQVPTNQPQQSSGTQPAAFPNPSSSSSSTGTLLIFLPLFGIGFCVAHALYYKSLDGTQVQTTWNQQEWASRFGNAFAFLAKTCFTGGIAVGYTQHIWTTFRKKSLTIEDIDAIFSATSDLTSFWWSDMWTRAKFATFLAILTWCVPFIAVITPGTLSIETSVVIESARQAVPSIDFMSCKFFRFSDFGNKILTLDYSTSGLVSRLITVTAAGVQVPPIRAPFPNASYSVDFFGPALKCTDTPEPTIREILENNPLSKGTSTVGIYQSIIPTMNYTSQLLMNHGRVGPGVNLTKAADPTTYYPNQVWFVYANATNTAVLLACQLHNSSYSVGFQFTNGQQTVQVNSLEYLEPVTDHTDAVDPKFDEDIQRTRKCVGNIGQAYVSIWTSLAGYFTSSIISGTAPGDMTTDGSSVGFLSTGLSGCDEPAQWLSRQPDYQLCRNRTFAHAVEDLSRNVTLGLFSSSDLWPKDMLEVNVTRSYAVNVYSYNSRNLLLAYGSGILAALIGVIAGLRAYWINGVCQGTSFSAILSTTRNLYLDPVVRGHSLGASPHPKKLRETKLQFGVAKGSAVGYGSGEVVARAAFGTEGSVRPLKKYEPCA